MKKIFLAFCLAAISVLTAFAQDSDDYKKGEFFVGYSSAIYVDDGAGVAARGVNVSGVYNFKKNFGLKADASATFDRPRSFRFIPGFDNPTQAEVRYKTAFSIYNFVGGIQVKNNSSKARFKPFAHAMAGVGQYREKVTEQFCNTPSNCANVPASENNTGFSFVAGGGLDIKINRRIDIRVVQFDLNGIAFQRSISNRSGIGTFRFGTGIVFK